MIFNPFRNTKELIFSYRFQKRKMIFLICQLVTAVAFLGIKFIKPINHQANVQFHCNDGVSDLLYCTPATESLDSCLLNNLDGNETSSAMLTCTVSSLSGANFFYNFQ